MIVPVISTIHIPEEDRAQLADFSTVADTPGDILAATDDGSGHFICINDGAGEWTRYSQAMRDLVEAFLALGYSHLRLDADGDIVPGLPKFG